MGAKRRATKFNLAAPGASVPFITPLQITQGAVKARVAVSLGASGKLFLYATD